MQPFIQRITLLTALVFGIAGPLLGQVPDLTKGIESIDRALTYNLGPTGLRGWIFTKAADNLDAAQGRTTLASRQILVTHVGAASPADYFKEGIAAAAGLAKTQGGHGSETRTGEIMKIITSYGTAAKPQIPALREVIAMFNHDTERGDFPRSLNQDRVGAVEDAIRSIETATSQPALRSVK